MTACLDQEQKEEVVKNKVNNEDLEPIRKWASKLNPKAKTIAVNHLWGDYYRVNVFVGQKLPDCVVEKISLSESYFVKFEKKKVVDLTKRSEPKPKNIFE